MIEGKPLSYRAYKTWFNRKKKAGAFKTPEARAAAEFVLLDLNKYRLNRRAPYPFELERTKLYVTRLGEALR